MCIVEDKTPRWKRVAFGTTNTKSLTNVFGDMNPIGMNLLRSDETFGMRRKLDFGKFSTWNRVGVSAIFRVGALLLASRNLRTASTRSNASGIARNSSGGQSPSHKHQRSMPLMNSSEPIQRRKNSLAAGSSLRNATFSPGVKR